MFKHNIVNCTWSDWGEWGSCSISCGNESGGSMIRERRKKTAETHGGVCVGNATSVSSCPSTNISCPPGEQFLNRMLTILLCRT